VSEKETVLDVVKVLLRSTSVQSMIALLLVVAYIAGLIESDLVGYIISFYFGAKTVQAASK